MTFAGFVLIAILLLTGVSGGYLFVHACVRRKELPWLVKEEMSRTPYAKYIDQIQEAQQWLLSHNAQDVWIYSQDGLKLHGLWIPAKKAKGTVLFAHGYRSCSRLDFGLAFSYYYERNMNLLVPDQRCHGKSEGRFITFGVKESTDMESWIAYHNAQFGDIPIVLCGLSMGASTMLYLTDRDLPDNVKGIIADCGFTSPHAILSSVFRDVTHLPAMLSLVVAELFARCFADFSLWECDTCRSLSGARIPVVMIHGKADAFVPCEMTRRGFDACTGPKQLLLVDGAEHGTSFLVEPETYKQIIYEFLEKIII